MADRMTYEYLIRRAYQCGRGGGPKGMADADYYSGFAGAYFERVKDPARWEKKMKAIKEAIASSFERQLSKNAGTVHHNPLSDFYQRTMAAETKEEIDKIIDEGDEFLREQLGLFPK